MSEPKQPSRFPRELLASGKDARFAYFRRQCTVEHTNLKGALGELRRYIRRSLDRRLIAFVGPTGVGKTKLKEVLERMVIEETAAELDADPGRVPLASFNLYAPERGTLAWSDVYSSCLGSMNEDLVTQHGARPPSSDDGPARWSHRRPTTAELRETLKETIRQRRPKAIIIDEAQHLMQMAGSGKRLSVQFDNLKSLADHTQTPHILVGPYQLLPFFDLHGQLSRRSGFVHMPRYDAANPDDLRRFNSVVLAFQRLLPLEGEPDLLQHYTYLYENTLGCVGLLKSWLDEALDIALEDEAPTLTRKHLSRCVLPVTKLRRILLEIKDGEHLVAEEGLGRDVLLAELNIDPNPPDSGEITAPDGEAPAKQERGKQRRRAFERKPSRDPVGVPEEMRDQATPPDCTAPYATLGAET